MKIEEAIKQTKGFRSPIEKALVNISFTSSWVHGNHHELLKPYGISIQQYNILRILKGQYPKKVTVKFLASRMIDKSSNASRLVDKLLAKDFVERHQCSNDRRRVDIGLTKVGIEALEQMNASMDSLMPSFDLTEEEANTLSDLLDKLRG